VRVRRHIEDPPQQQQQRPRSLFYHAACLRVLLLLIAIVNDCSQQQSWVRKMQGQKLLYKRQHTEAAVRIQTARRGMLARRHYVRQKGAAVQIQSARRGFVARRRFKRQAGTHDELVRTRGRGGYGELEQQWLRHKHEQEATKTTGAWKRVRKSQVLWSLVASRQAANSRFCVFDAFDAQQRDLRAAFNATDVSGDGALDVDEIWRLVHSLGVSPEQLSVSRPEAFAQSLPVS
jgi:hypothetical protein